jgi:hypothetical protein
MDGSVMAGCVTAARAGRFPLLAFLYSVLQLARHSSFASVLKSEHGGWWDLDHHSKTGKDSDLTLSFAVRVLEILITGCSVGHKDVRMQYTVCLKEFFQVPRLMHVFLYFQAVQFLKTVLKMMVFYVIPALNFIFKF